MGFQLRKDLKKFLPFLFSSLLFSGLALGIGKEQVGVLAFFYHFCIVASLGISAISFLWALMMTWTNFYHSFYSAQAYLIRTLPLSRSAIFTGVLVDGILYDFCAGMLLGANILLVFGTELDLVFQEYGNLAALFLGACFCQLLTYQACGYAGIYLGFKRLTSKWGFSVLFGFLLYYALEILIVGGLFGYLSLRGYLNVEVLSLEEIKRLLQAILIGYILVLIPLFIFLYVSIRKGVDTDQ